MFNKNFQFGVATSSYQIEGSKVKGANLNSIWDAFAKKQGTVEDGSDGSVACEHVIRYKDDISLMKKLGVDVYRFSISWTRIIPKEGEVSSEGLDFYFNLFKELKANGIKAAVTMYHWDMPQWIYEKNGGWTTRETAYLFLEYAKILFDNFDKHVDNWVTLNEPHVSAYLGYFSGEHAPGHKNAKEYFRAVHYLNLAHGLAVEYYKSNYNKPIGIVVNLLPVYTTGNYINNKIAQSILDATINRMHLDSIFKGLYPMDFLIHHAPQVEDYDFIKDSDSETISVDIDFLGINYYTRSYVKYGSASSPVEGIPTELKRTTMGWEVYPDGLYDIIHRVRKEYTDIPIVISENGSAWKDNLIDGKVHDEDRIEYLNSHLGVVDKLNDEGMNIVGYFAWSFMDNFEWAFGYNQRFGIVYVDYETQKRYPKDSYYRYQEIIKNRKL